LKEGEIEGLFLAATIHDVDKINVPAELLSKPGKLTPLEYQMLQTHVQASYEIITGIKFAWPIAREARRIRLPTGPQGRGHAAGGQDPRGC
jgi:HD-GYP domain-containing protein (c-di-GMP phosphodiesterase class II)